MGVNFDIVYHPDVVEKDIPKLSSFGKDKIKKAIEEKLTAHPEVFGKPLRRSLKGYRKLRVGDHRVIYRIEGKKVKIFYIGHRSIVYEKANKRV
ncbi:MAG: type II toxin-antitoxin system RelE/ParE family toxin [Candidatus Terrybacteria bacterium CG10_big_fil_rev_8_21_14_0_10_41_10]|uniref:Type II toxin-antitoxin system RelE/ParE family toxin n=1 Tax=Candidatus Terrybacteria bacterium CG10_big_fil_rev_8_21_14_0_10_41_10 TaxID=1975026 RepID=A0A2M8L9Y3_9BACT|nr:MAG: type II toxin-antitoxin system RelE/ParE family toxin [Candidatus Terrybacteria bacterium CG10_big_fil_rev_8_21_14_0_10_41_10]